ncbi:Polyketide cyclase / dehydrase and lipid transport [Mycobacterium basiliense]|uniref:Polyketide cyclase / dehydrase and lipid transport n=1 Tax=Mycobacterium basiliense TaxID=2094119 RepID=A0A3S4FMP6_9MYCO|nr:Polyketide cyclase / dehydrase and lipid transport [Mycobacterium basiliense]
MLSATKSHRPRCLDVVVADADSEPRKRIVSATREIAASAETLFELIADPAHQPEWDGNENLAHCPAGQRVRQVGDVFRMTLTMGTVRENHVVEFTEGRRIAWHPSEPGRQPPGHLWRWQLTPVGPTRTAVTHTYDWTELTDPARCARAQATTVQMLRASPRSARRARGSNRLGWEMTRQFVRTTARYRRRPGWWR